MLLNDALAWFFRGYSTPEGYYLVRITNYFAFFSAFLLIPLLAKYLSYIVSIRSGYTKPFWRSIEWILSFLGIILITVNIFWPFLYSFDDNNRYYRLEAAYLPAAIACTSIFISFCANIQYVRYMNHAERLTYLVSAILVFSSAIAQIFFYGVSFIYLSLVITTMLIFICYIHNYMEYNLQLQKQIAEERIRLINQQIQPHFIFNSLSLIRHLCTKAPDEAIEAINEFSGYLRSSTDFLNEPECIPAAKEIDLVKHYIFMQKKRFADGISVEFDIEDTNFMIPPFAVQTFAENAIRHGLRSEITSVIFDENSDLEKNSLISGHSHQD